MTWTRVSPPSPGRRATSAASPPRPSAPTLMDRLLPDQEHEDDVCLLVLRVLPDDGPRP